MTKIGVIIDNAGLARWQADALLAIATETEFIIYSCTTVPPRKRRLRHALYYLLNMFTVRNRMTRRVDLPRELRIVGVRRFATQNDGVWQQLPPGLLTAMRSDSPSVLIKFGMGLLRIPSFEQLPIPILSYHHGNPAKFRGRPAGFYELLEGDPTVGQIVQILSNELDAGDIVATAETRAIPYSYRATLIESYRHSPLLLRVAVRNAVAGASWRSPQSGAVYRLPDNATVVKFVLARLRKGVSHLLYGLTREKRWGVATVAVPNQLSVETLIEPLADELQWTILATPPGYRFLADPFFHPNDGLVVEAMRKSSARGQILRASATGCCRVSGRAGHMSYPAVIESEGRAFVIPEVSDWSPPLAFPLEGTGLGEPFALRLPGRPPLLDPTPLWYVGTLFLFGNIAAEGPSVLRLWVADSLEGDFVEHPSSPIRVSPNGGRMAGTPIFIDGSLVRFGQDLRGAYGHGISAYRVTKINRDAYAEEAIDEFRFQGRRGPHTLNLARGVIAFDYYDDVVSLLAGIRRYRDRRAARRVGD